MKRLFFALWPDAEVRKRCLELMRMLACGEGRPVAPGNLHVTLDFMGSVDSVTEAALTQAADRLVVGKMVLRFDRLEFWRKPGIVCLTCSEPEPSVAVLAAELSAVSAGFGIAGDERPYTPHVTLMRKVRRPRETVFDPIIWTADSFCLVESRTLPEGVDYRVIRSWP